MSKSGDECARRRGCLKAPACSLNAPVILSMAVSFPDSASCRRGDSERRTLGRRTHIRQRARVVPLCACRLPASRFISVVHINLPKAKCLASWLCGVAPHHMVAMSGAGLRHRV